MRKERSDTPLISICVINYNAEAYLAECIRSIAAQTYTNIEIVFCDDASTDGSTEVFEQLVDSLDGFRLIRIYQDKNVGAERNMLAGLRAFTGEYVCNIDSDDVLSSDHIERLYRLIQETGADIACTGHAVFTDEDQLDALRSTAPAEALDQQYRTLSTDSAIPTLYLQGNELPFQYWHRLYGRAASQRLIELPFDYFANSDSAFSLVQFCEAETVAVSDAPTYYYRIHDSVSHRSVFDYWSQKAFGSLDSLSAHYSTRRTQLIELNTARNRQALVVALRACIAERRGYAAFKNCWRERVDVTGRRETAALLSEDVPPVLRKAVFRSLHRTPALFYFYRRLRRLLKRDS